MYAPRGRIWTLPPIIKAVGQKAGLGSPANPQPGTAALRSAGVPPAGSGSVPLPFLVVMPRCAPPAQVRVIELGMGILRGKFSTRA